MKIPFYNISLILTLAVIPGIYFSCQKSSPVTATNSENSIEKEMYLPDTIYTVPFGNDFHNNESEYSFQRSVSSDNFVIFWSKEIGEEPMKNPDSTKRFDVNEILKECERFYKGYTDDLKFVEKGNSYTDQYKTLIFIIGGEEGTAFGGGEGNIGVLWTPPSRINKAPYGALAHELGHSFQYLVNRDGAWGFTSSAEGSHGHAIFEMTSQYMLWQVESEWMAFENYHLKSFMEKTHYAFLHETNMYHSPYVLEYWSEKHGVDFIGKLWRESRKGEDPVMAYQRLTGIDQNKFNDEIFDAYRRFITWDMNRVEQVASPYANQHFTKLDELNDGWYQITPSNCPQNYGYNGIKLQVPPAGTTVTLGFEGIVGANGFRSVQPEKAGWRYGFLAVKENGDRIYGDIYSDVKGKISFKVPSNTVFLWLVVSGAPKEHWEHLIDGNDENDEQWPYRIKLSGTIPDATMIN